MRLFLQLETIWEGITMVPQIYTQLYFSHFLEEKINKKRSVIILFIWIWSTSSATAMQCHLNLQFATTVIFAQIAVFLNAEYFSSSGHLAYLFDVEKELTIRLKAVIEREETKLARLKSFYSQVKLSPVKFITITLYHNSFNFSNYTRFAVFFFLTSLYIKKVFIDHQPKPYLSYINLCLTLRFQLPYLKNSACSTNPPCSLFEIETKFAPVAVLFYFKY